MLMKDEFVFRPGKGGPQAPCLYLIDMQANPIDLSEIQDALSMNVIGIFVTDWDNDLTPWPAPGLYPQDPPFKGNADETLDVLIKEVIPAAEEKYGLKPRARAIGGYSLGGLFSTYAFIMYPDFRACASMSGSLWYEDWSHFAKQVCAKDAVLDAFEGRYAYFSIGSQERKSPPRILSTVEQRNQDMADLLTGAGAITKFYVGPGNHFQHIPDRITRGLLWVDEQLAQAQ